MMHIKLIKVQPAEKYTLILTYSNGEIKLSDMKPYLNIGIFKELKNQSLFNTAKKSFDTAEWANEADMDPEVLYNQSIIL